MLGALIDKRETANDKKHSSSQKTENYNNGGAIALISFIWDLKK